MTEGRPWGPPLFRSGYIDGALRNTEKLLSIAAQHPGAPVVRDAAAFRELRQELFAKG